MGELVQLDNIIISLYFIFIIFMTFYYSKKQTNSLEDYFTVKSSVHWAVIGFALFATNISTEHFLGLTGYGSARGIAVANIEWMAIVFLILLGWFFAPYYLREKVYTTPQILEKRFNRKIKKLVSGLSILMYTFTKVSISLFAGGLILERIFGLNIYSTALIILVLTGIYTIIGGLRVVTYLSFYQAMLLILAAVLVAIFSFSDIPSLEKLVHSYPESHFHLFKPMSDPDFPWTGILLGAPILAFWYWCIDQYMVQKLLAAKSCGHARNGALFTGILKLLPVLLLVIPGLAIGYHFPGARGDQALAIFLQSDMIPAGIRGLIIVGIIAAMMSSISSSFIASSSLLVIDIFDKETSKMKENQAMLLARLSTIFMVIAGMLWIPLLRMMDNYIYVLLQQIQAYFSPPIAVVFLFGLFSKRVNSFGAIGTLIIGELIGILKLIVDYTGIFPMVGQINFLHFAVLLFILSVFLIYVLSALKQSESLFCMKDRMLQIYHDTWIHQSMKNNSISALYATNRSAMHLSLILIISLFIFWGFFL